MKQRAAFPYNNSYNDDNILHFTLALLRLQLEYDLQRQKCSEVESMPLVTTIGASRNRIMDLYIK